jgi:hypothetical protein
MKIRLIFLFACAMVVTISFGQTPTDMTEKADGSRVINTVAPFLTISPDARAGGMGNVGVSTTPDVYSMFWNPAKYAFIEKSFGVGIGYVPWLRSLVNDIGLASLVGFWKINDKQAIAMSLRYFSMGEVQFTNEDGIPTILVKPNEWTIDGTYSRKFSREFSGAVAGRFIYSNLVPGGTGGNGVEVRPGTSVAADIAIYYHHVMEVKGISAASIDFGLNISNIGAKMSYGSSTRDFLPTTLRLGPTFNMDIDDYNRLSFSIDLSKLLVPTPPIYAKDSTGAYLLDASQHKIIEKGMNPDVSPIKGMIQSFYDAPYGLTEELQEINISVAAEYWYNKLFSVRAGYFYESVYKGDRQFFTLGAGLRYNVFGLDFSYLIPVKSNNPLQHTLQFTLLFNFDANKKAAADKEEGGTTK